MASEPKDLVPVEAVPLPDLYERKYMEDAGVVLFRDKSRAPWPLHAIFLVAMTTVTVAAVTAGAAFALLFSLPTLALVWLFFAVLRVTVSEGAVNVQYGLFGPKIPISAIASVEAVDYDWKKVGGWGIRYAGKREWMYNMPGDGGRAVRITWRDRRGRRVTAIGSRHAADLAAAVRHAQKALPPADAAPALPASDDE